MAEDVKVRLSPEGVNEVVNALKKIQFEARKASEKGAGGIDAVTKSTAAFGNVLGALGFATTVAGFVAMGRAALKTAEDVGTVSQQIAASVENTSAVLATARKANVSEETVQGGLTKLVKNLGEFKRGTGNASDFFDDLNISAKDFAGKDTVEAFSLIANRMAGITDEGEKARIAIGLFGNSGAALVPVLNELGTKGIDAVREKLAGLGTLVTSDLAKTADEVNNLLGSIGKQGNAKVLNFLAGFAPFLNEVLTEFQKEVQGKGVEPMREFGEKAGNALLVVAGLFKVLYSIAAGAFNVIGKGIGNTAAALLSLAKGDFKSAFEIVKAGASDTSDEIGDVFKTIFEEVGAVQNRLSKGVQKPKGEAGGKGGGAGGLNGEAGDTAGSAVAERAQKAIADALKKSGAEQIAIISDINKQRREENEKSAASDRAALEARLAAQGNTLKAQQELEKFDIAAIARRRDAAAAAFVEESANNQRRTELVTARVRKGITSEKELSEALKQINRQSDAERLASGQAYLSALQAAQVDYFNKYKAAQQQIVALDKETADFRKKSEDARNGILEANYTAEQKQQLDIRRSWETEGQLRDAVLAGNLDKARQLRDELLAAGQRIGGGVGLQLIDSAQDKFELLAAQQKLVAQDTAKNAEAGAKAVAEQIAVIKTELETIRTNTTVDLKTELNKDALKGVVQSIQDAFDKNTFRIKVSATEGGGSVSAPGLADGGMVPGMSPHSRADNVLIRATAGEFMQPVAAVRHYGTDFMDAIRNMELPRFAAGGMVGAGGGAENLGSLDLSIGGKSMGRVTSERATLRRIARAVDSVKRGT